MIKFMISSSCAILDNFFRSSLAAAHTLIPYVGIPSCANIEKYVIIDVANDTFPVPTGRSILETYGNVINGNINDDIVRMMFIKKFSFRDLFFSSFINYSLLNSFNVTIKKVYIYLFIIIIF